MNSFQEYLESKTKKTVHKYALENRWYFAVGNGIFIVDLKRGVVSLDPDGDIVRRGALEPLLTFLIEMHGLGVQILKDMQDTWYLRMEFPKFSEGDFMKNVQPQLKELESHWIFVRAANINTKTEILVGLDPPPEKSIRLEGLRKTAEILAEIAKIVPKKSGRKTTAAALDISAKTSR